jgi:hypothetical protein
VRDKERLDLCGRSTLFPRSGRLCLKKNCLCFTTRAWPFVEKRVQKFQGLLHSWSSVLLYEIRRVCLRGKRKLSFRKIRSTFCKSPAMNPNLMFVNYLTKKTTQSTTNICLFEMCQLHVSTSTQPSSWRSATQEKNNARFRIKVVYMWSLKHKAFNSCS